MVFKSHTGPCEICGGQSGVPLQYHYSNAPHSSSCCFYQKDKRANPLSLPKGNALSISPVHWTDQDHWVLQILPTFRILVFRDVSPVRTSEVFRRVNQRVTAVDNYNFAVAAFLYI